MNLELADLIPDGWQLAPSSLGTIRMVAPSDEDARSLVQGARRSLQASANRLGSEIQVWASGASRPVLSVKAAQSSPVPPEEPPQVSSYAPDRIAPDASYEAIADFMRGKRAEGLIVTVTSMVSDKCLAINDLQVLDRGVWTADDWAGIDFKRLWRDSFLQGRHNYYADLIARVQRDAHIPEFLYQIRRPSGALAEYSSTYHLVQSFCGIPARIAVSRVGDWRIVEGQE